jgi:hypothetical protein
MYMVEYVIDKEWIINRKGLFKVVIASDDNCWPLELWHYWNALKNSPLLPPRWRSKIRAGRMYWLAMFHLFEAQTGRQADFWFWLGTNAVAAGFPVSKQCILRAPQCPHQKCLVIIHKALAFNDYGDKKHQVITDFMMMIGTSYSTSMSWPEICSTAE